MKNVDIFSELTNAFSNPTDKTVWIKLKDNISKLRKEQDIEFKISHKPLKHAIIIKPILYFKDREDLMGFLKREKKLALEFQETELAALVHLLENRDKLEVSHFEIAVNIEANQAKTTISYYTNMLTFKYKLYEFL